MREIGKRKRKEKEEIGKRKEKEERGNRKRKEKEERERGKRKSEEKEERVRKKRSEEERERGLSLSLSRAIPFLSNSPFPLILDARMQQLKPPWRIYCVPFFGIFDQRNACEDVDDGYPDIKGTGC